MTREQLVLMQHLRAGEPVLPLSDGEAAAQAYRLRVKHGISYTALSRIMGEYHGVWTGESEWRRKCRMLGAPVVRPKTMTPQMRARDAA